MNLRTLALPFLLSTAAFLGGCKKDPCKDVTCQNGGSCADGSCLCPAGFEGSSCQAHVRAKFLGNYDVQETCATEIYNYSFTISAGGSSATAIVIHNLADWLTVNGNVNGNNLTVPTQLVTQDGQEVTVTASGQLSGNTLNMTYTISAGGDTDHCTAVAIR